MKIRLDFKVTFVSLLNQKLSQRCAELEFDEDFLNQGKKVLLHSSYLKEKKMN